MSIYKEIKSSDISVKPVQTNKSFNLSSSLDTIQSIQFRSGSGNLSGSYWESLRINFYLSGSDLATEDSKFNNPYHSRIMDNPTNKQHSNKFHSSGSVISITSPDRSALILWLLKCLFFKLAKSLPAFSFI